MRLACFQWKEQIPSLEMLCYVLLNAKGVNVCFTFRIPNSLGKGKDQLKPATLNGELERVHQGRPLGNNVTQTRRSRFPEEMCPRGHCRKQNRKNTENRLQTIKQNRQQNKEGNQKPWEERSDTK